MKEESLIIFIKNPQPGRCKTRLAQSIGNDAALSVYRKLLNYTQHISLKHRDEKILFYDSFIDTNDEWDSKHFRKKLQCPGDLGDRMLDAFTTVLSESNKAVIIGSDCPEITIQHIEKSFALLDSHDLVIGPSHDGGYYLLGMKQPHSEIFKQIEWSSSSVLDKTISRIQNCKLSYALIEQLHDLDDADDLEKFPEYLG